MSDNVELAVEHLLPVCPVAAKIGSMRKKSQISTLVGYLKRGTVTRTGFQLQYYNSHEYQNLSQKDKYELSNLRPKHGGNSEAKGNGRRNEKGVSNKINGHGNGNGKVNGRPWKN